MPLNKPRRGDLDWDVTLNASLDYLDAKVLPTGPTGPAGAVGPTGPLGATGATGPALNPVAVRWSPVFSATGLTFTGSGTTYPTYNSYYVQVGKLVTFQIEVSMTTVTSFGTGQFKLALPVAPTPTMQNHFMGWINVDPTQNPDVVGHFIINADHVENTSVLDLHYVKATGPNSAIAEASLVQGTPATLTTASRMYINGTYIAA